MGQKGRQKETNLRLKRVGVFILLSLTVLSLFIVPVFADFDSWQVNAQDDDVYKTGTTFSKADTIQLVGNDYWAGMPPFVPPADFECRSWFRWTDVTIEQGATIESAFFGTFARRYGNPETIFYGIDEDNTTTYSSDPDGRPLTDASVQFDPDWALYQYDWRTSPDIKSVVQEIVDRENWISGNALGIKWGDDGSPTGSDNYASLYSFDMNPIYGCFLNVTWTILGGDETAPTFSNVGTNASHCREVCEFSCLWEDETELSGYIFGWNGTGSFVNDTWTSLSGGSSWANVTKTLPSFECVVSYAWFCNDTSDNWNTTGLQYLNVTSEAPPPSPPHWITFALTVYTTVNGGPCPLNVTVERYKTLLSDDNGTVRFSLPMGAYVVSVSCNNLTQERSINLDRDLSISFDFQVTSWDAIIKGLVGCVIVSILVVWIGPDLLPKKQREKVRVHKDNLKIRGHKSTLKQRGHKSNVKVRGHKSTTKPRVHKDNLKKRKHKR